MSSPYHYAPNAYYPTPYLEPYYNQPHRSPFIPPAHLYPSSPYHPSSPLPDPTTPNTPRRVRFEDELPPWDDLPPRQRRPSWHAPASRPMVTPVQTPSVPFLALPTLGHNRRHSYGNTPFQNPWPGFGTPLQQPGAPWMQAYQPPPFLIHPYLNGESPRPDFVFDLSSPAFTPVRVIGPGQTAFLTTEECRQPATHPAVFRMRIVCDAIPQWPIELAWNYLEHGDHLDAVNPQVPITLGDVLIAIHRSLQTQITHLDWGRLTLSEEEAIARAYTRRCRSLPSMSHVEASQGVRRIDYLLDRFMFKGLVRTSSDHGWENLKLVV